MEDFSSSLSSLARIFLFLYFFLQVGIVLGFNST